MDDWKPPHIVVLGAGFGGLTFCQEFNFPSARVTLIDRQNHHLFQPLLYQVAMAGLSAPEIAQPIRSILADRANVSVLLDNVVEIDLKRREIVMEKNVLSYDYLVIGLGGETSYFGHPEWAEFAPGLKSIDDALRIRRRALLAFEKAENEPDPVVQQRLMTVVVVGGGPTGVELAGAFAELARHVLRSDFRRIDPAKARVVLVEASPEILSTFSPELSQSALRQLERLGVEVLTHTRVKSIREGVVEFESGSVIPAETLIWAAGVSANRLTARLGVELDRAGRIKVQPDLSIPQFPEAFAIGDIAHVIDKRGRLVPGVSPGAMQMARHVARIIENELTGGAGTFARPAFAYFDKGSMATIGRSAAIAKVGPLELDGFIAWIAWLVVHLIFLVGFRNKIAVLLQWTYSYLAYKRGARLITGLSEEVDYFKTKF